MARKTNLPQQESSIFQRRLRVNAVAPTLFAIIFLLAGLGAYLMVFFGFSLWVIALFSAIMLILGVLPLASLKIAAQWEKAVVLRFGKYHIPRPLASPAHHSPPAITTWMLRWMPNSTSRN